jgi:DNA-directed RNA polymerase subunit RPC12/RpoP
MKFLNFLKAKDKEPEEPLTQIGETDSICPYCQTRLDNMPTRKKKCPSCKEDIFVRTRPLDEKKILIKESQIDEVEKQWAIKNGDLEQYYAKIKHREEREQRFESKKEQLRNQFGYEPKENDIQWALYNEDRIVAAGDGEWAIYSSTTMHMGNQLKKEKNFDKH